MPDILPELAAALGDRYQIESPLGEGGMALVYLAIDRKHNRRVALKVLRPELASALGPERFLREIEIAAGLHHPHILPLYDSGRADGPTVPGRSGGQAGRRAGDSPVAPETDDETGASARPPAGPPARLYYVMPFVEGESLRDRLDREKQLPLDDALRIAREVADALSYAHSRGVVHRDIKPENILLESGHAMVADFGIARAIGEAGAERLTSTGLALGTPGYMSPEQGAGERDLDGRSDVYALGCVLYEMLAGQPPFTGPTVESVVHQHLMTEPRPVTQLRPAVPDEVARIIGRALAKTPADRWQTAGAFEAALAGTVGRPDGQTGREGQSAGPPVRRSVLFRGWGWGAVGAAVLAVAALALLWPRRSAPQARPTLVVLPFENLGAPEDEYFADGITEEVTSRLAQISGLGVTSRTSALLYKDRKKTLPEIGHELGVAYVLEGTVRTDRSPDGNGQVRVTPQLIRVADDTHLWADRYTAALTPGAIFSAQAQIAEQVASALDVKLLGGERLALARAPTADRQAHEAYLQGRFYWNRRTPADLQRAAERFEFAVERDSSYAQAWAGLADTYVLFPIYRIQQPPRPEAYRRARDAADRAIRLDSTLAEPHASRGLALFYGWWDFKGSEEEFRRAIALDSTYPVAHYWYTELLIALDRVEEAEHQARLGVALAPAASVAHHLLGAVLGTAGKLDEAKTEAETAITLAPDFTFPFTTLAHVALLKGQWAAADSLFQRAGVPPDVARIMVEGYRYPDRSARLVREVAPLLKDNPRPVEVAQVYAFIRQRDSMLTYLERAYQMRAEILAIALNGFALGPMRADSSLNDLRRRVGVK